jgi:dihydroorotate dehydrogenase
MSLFSAYPLLRPALFALDAERAHNLTFQGLDIAGGLGLLPTSAPLAGKAVSLCGLKFANPVGLAAGLDKNAAHLDALGSFGFGFIEVGTVTPKPQPGNPKPRMFRLPQHQALINRLGFNNLGLSSFIANVSASRWAKEKRGVLGLNIGKNAATPIDQAVNDYVIGLENVFPYADYVAVNISSPNTKNLRDLQSEAALDALLMALKKTQAQLQHKHQRRVPLFLKIAPDLDQDQIHQIANRIRHHDVEGVIATNTTLDRQHVAGHQNAHEAGGLSGAPLLTKSNQVIAALAQFLGRDTPVIGVGGILSGADAAAKMAAGAQLVQVYTGLIYRGPALVAEAVRATLSA